MPLPRALARLNRVLVNPVTLPFAAVLPGFAVLHHIGRETGSHYATPLNAWRRGDEVVVALTYGHDVDWLLNARATAPSSLVMRGVTIEVGAPRDVDIDEGLAVVPDFIHPLLRAVRVTGFVAFPIE